ncbi:tyrosine-type recombinase/integrase [Paraburkholderia strydomiana]|uniref:tyrosine-type recombinase/integrase n=1 Tax=Paraburkholderia strydomiana TaxID=1245417 RepID=UPI0038BDD0B8
MLPTVPRKLTPFLDIEQCRALLRSCGTRTLQLMTKLMLQTGLRNEECRTFPTKYLFDPSPGRRSGRLAIELRPSDMRLKGNRPRRIYVSGQLLKDLFDFANFGEGSARARLYRMAHGNASPFLFLNKHGSPWSDKGLSNAYRKLWCPDNHEAPALGFRVTPHMLRHTFATLELYAESQNRNLGHALAWVRDRLGHTSVSTTTIYVHCLDMLGEQCLNRYQQELDALLLQDR